jgi:polar amino acid transport system substrate-binding protein
VRRLAALLLLLAGVVAAPSAQAAPPPTLVAGTLTVGLQLPTQGFQVGSVIGTDVVYARGLEIDLARAVAQRLELPTVRFVQEPRFTDIFVPGAKAWDLLLAQVTITNGRSQTVDFSAPYLRSSQGVLLREELRPRPRTIKALRGLKLCAERGTTGEDTVFDRIKPTVRPIVLGSHRLLLQYLADRRCDAAVSDAPILGAERAAVPDRYGPLVGQIPTQERYGAVLPKGSPARPAVDAALNALVADGTVAALSKKWLTVDVAKLPVLR